MLIRLLRPITYLGSSLFAIGVLVNDDHARTAAGPFKVQSLTVPPEMQHLVKSFAAYMEIPSPQHIYVFASNSLSAFSGGHPTRPGGAVVGLPLTFLASGPNDPLWEHIGLQAGDGTDGDGILATLRRHTLPSMQHKGFTICHELTHVKEKHTRKRAFLFPALTVVCYEGWAWVARKRLRRPTHQAAAGACAAVLAGLSFVFMSWFQEIEADMAAGRVSPELCVGGLESLQWHTEMTQLLSGKSTTGMTLTHPPIALRRAVLERIMTTHHKRPLPSKVVVGGEGAEE